LVITAFVFSDLMDGYMARKTGHTSAWGAFLDSTMDRFGDAAIFGGLLLYYVGPHAETMLGTPILYVYVSLACLVLGSVTSYVRAKAESLGMTAKVGVAERAERLVIILVATAFNGIFGLPILTELALWFLAAASGITVIQRMIVVRKQATSA
jgi:CDP-diacylglycerol--glycerol-3-phosphate 3-phosphatidyltransferase/CDP-diacylglycerol--inositol 3-phosphatidyltransferase